MNQTSRYGLEQFNENPEMFLPDKVLDMQDSQIKLEPTIICGLTEPENAYTGKHVERTQIFCHLLALELRRDPAYEKIITEEYVINIYYAAAFHDAGKNFISNQILLKEGKLDQEEYETVKTHTVIGKKYLAKMLAGHSMNEFATMCIQIAGSHHERWDGTGYPDGLYGLDIPLPARIMALVDVYDALRTKLPYKEAVPHEKSVRIIMEGGGIDFDPSIVKAFSNIEAQFKHIYEMMSEGSFIKKKPDQSVAEMKRVSFP